MENKPKAIKKVATMRKQFTILHLTDTHVDLEYQEGFNTDCGEPFCCRQKDGPGKDAAHSSGKWGSLFNCDIPLSTLEQSLI